MTFKDFQKRTGIVAITLPSGALQVFPKCSDTWNLYHLDDYVVSSAVSGPSLILVKRAF